jgi:hypothetical protein
MSDTFDPDDEMPDDPFSAMEDHVRAAADTLMERWQAFEDKARTLGLYLEGHPQIAMVPMPPHGQPVVALQVMFQMGRVAFSDRVQFPEKEKVDDTARVMEVGLKDDMFLDERQRIADGLAAGKTMDEILLGDEDDAPPT